MPFCPRNERTLVCKRALRIMRKFNTSHVTIPLLSACGTFSPFLILAPSALKVCRQSSIVHWSRPWHRIWRGFLLPELYVCLLRLPGVIAMWCLCLGFYRRGLSVL
ncbi:hypothetical protein BX661DRAFT_29493 [Kickxella alabastrina]|uniref:uncharacterized protein n=1 Tax=Kickxella alabastrina TaxID=61397 RepID=UPI00221F4B38|nr:uncharacterized protein BX661DRAFT_29493 [Kickxella alabastrina]KAI7826695.1 hypothetical protein BX661DRAFT_29493 [Kickxella alabastrina]